MKKTQNVIEKAIGVDTPGTFAAIVYDNPNDREMISKLMLDLAMCWSNHNWCTIIVNTSDNTWMDELEAVTNGSDIDAVRENTGGDATAYCRGDAMIRVTKPGWALMADWKEELMHRATYKDMSIIDGLEMIQDHYHDGYLGILNDLRAKTADSSAAHSCYVVAHRETIRPHAGMFDRICHVSVSGDRVKIISKLGKATADYSAGRFEVVEND